jgi:hypothetical protein
MCNSPSWEEYPIDVLELKPRSYNVLRRSNIQTLGQLLVCIQDKQLEQIKWVGGTIAKEVEEKFHIYITNYYNNQKVYAHPQESHLDATLSPAAVEEVDRSLDRLPLYPAWHFYSILELDCHPRLLHLLQKNGYLTLGSVSSLTEVTTPRKIGVKGLGSKHFADIRSALSSCLATLPSSAFSLIKSSVELTESEHRRNDLTLVTLSERIQNWLNSINNERARNVIKWRYGFVQEAFTLDEIGLKFGVTRERVRQIERRTLLSLTNPKHDALITEVMVQIKITFEKLGGIFTTEEFDASASFCPSDMRISGLLNLFARISGEFGWDSRANVWVWDQIRVVDIQSQIRKMLKSMYPLDKSTFITELRQANPDLKEQFLMGCLRTHPDLDVRDDGVLVYKNLARHRTGVIIQALRQIGRPAHYTEITEEVNRLLPEEIEAYPHNIHAHMQRLPDIFVWVGRGTYGLAEAGLERSEFYADIIERIFRECGHPLSIQETLSRLCDVRDCKESTVMMLLTLNPRFRTFPGDVYGLAEWQDDDFFDPLYREKRLLAAVTEDEFLNRRKPKTKVARTLRNIDNLFGTARSDSRTAKLPLFDRNEQ